MTFDQFYNEYNAHGNEKPVKKERRYDGYELHFQNGDIYIYNEDLIPGRTVSSWSKTYMMSDFITSATWNGQNIKH